MRRRQFIRNVAVGAAALRLSTRPLGAAVADPPSYAKQMPTTPFAAPRGSWTLAVLPDTQNYSSRFPAVYHRQCEWLVAHRDSHNIKFVAHEGDIVNEQERPQWENARAAMHRLNAARIPYSLIPGNHDLGPLGHFCADRSTLLNEYFHEGDYEASATHQLYRPGEMENSWHTFETPTGPYLVLALEYGPRDPVVEWAHAAVLQHPRHKVVLVTHAYLYCDSTRYGESAPGVHQKWNPKGNPGLKAAGGNVNDGHDLWEKLVSRSPRFQFTLNGHVLENGTGRLASRGPAGNVVHQILANYQAGVQVDDGAGGIAYAEVRRGAAPHGRAFGGGGFLRLMQFHPDGTTVAIRTYSPWYDRWLTQPDQQFTVSLAEGAKLG